MNFILKHWHGQYPLAISFWIFFLILGIAFHLISFFILEQTADTKSNHIMGIVIYQLTGGLLLFPWQAIGLLRSAEFHYSQFGRPVVLHSVQAVILISLALLASHFVGIVQKSTVDHSLNEFRSRFEPPKYSVQLSDDGKKLIVKGTLDFGITEAVSLLLKAHPDIKKVMLDSEGGRIYEGRGLAALFDRHGVDTYTDNYCLSSCTTAFIGGAKRYLGENAKLGFHQYAFDSKRLQVFESFYSLQDEQNKDLEIYRSKGISEQFIQQIFKKPNSEIWYPSRKALLKAGVVNEIVYPNAPKAPENN
ncbi:MAG: hypothetical protein ACI8XX_002563 [Polaribacter sp.]|jgi:hypothetical protein